MPTHRNDTALATLLRQANHLKQERQALIDRLEQIVQSEKWRRELSSSPVLSTGAFLMLLTQMIIAIVKHDEERNPGFVFGVLFLLPVVMLSGAASVKFLATYNQFKKLKIIAKLPECTALKLDERLPDSFWTVRNSMRARRECEALLGSHYANMLAQAKIAPLGQTLPFNIGEDHPLLLQPKTQEKTSWYRWCTGFFARNTPSGEDDGQPLLLGGQGAAYGAIDDDIEAQRHSAEEGGGGGAGPSMSNLYDAAAGAASANLEADHGAGAAALPLKALP